jgi:hypothetical protein
MIIAAVERAQSAESGRSEVLAIASVRAVASRSHAPSSRRCRTRRHAISDALLGVSSSLGAMTTGRCSDVTERQGPSVIARVWTRFEFFNGCCIAVPSVTRRVGFMPS